MVREGAHRQHKNRQHKNRQHKNRRHKNRRHKNRQHFDLRPMVGAEADGVTIEVRRLVELGASVLGEDGDLVVMADPEGNEFCVE